MKKYFEKLEVLIFFVLAAFFLHSSYELFWGMWLNLESWEDVDNAPTHIKHIFVLIALLSVMVLRFNYDEKGNFKAALNPTLTFGVLSLPVSVSIYAISSCLFVWRFQLHFYFKFGVWKPITAFEWSSFYMPWKLSEIINFEKWIGLEKILVGTPGVAFAMSLAFVFYVIYRLIKSEAEAQDLYIESKSRASSDKSA